MALEASCPRCSSPVSSDDAGWRCDDHGPIVPLWRPRGAGYEPLTEHLLQCVDFPTWLPWPLSPGWTVTDFGCVGTPGGATLASFISCRGTSDLDGIVELSVVTEEPGVGLGARHAGVHRSDPGEEIMSAAPHVKVRLGGHPTPLWSVPTWQSTATFDRSVFAGEAHGRWLWLVLRPASAALLLSDEWILLDVNGLGPELIDVPFGENPPPW